MKVKFFLVILFISNALAYGQNDQKFGFKSLPYLQNMNETGVTVMWLANKMCTSYILYGETEAPTIKVRASHHGQIDANIPIQKIRLTNLLPGKKYYYRVVSKEITKYQAYDVEYGDSIVSKVYSFTLPCKTKSKFNIIAFNDMHGEPAYIDTVCAHNPDFDFALYAGDVVSDISDEKQIFDNLCDKALGSYAGLRPFVYIRGNHELRGPESRILYNYIDTPNGEFYYSFMWGKTYFLIIDGGEDKEDNHPVYGGLIDFDNYRTEQANWIKKIVASKEWKNADHRIVCSHIPISLGHGDGWHGTTEIRNKIAPVLNAANVDLIISGHTHEAALERPNRDHNYALIVGGSPVTETHSKSGATFIKISVDGKRIKAKLYKKNGSLIDEYEIKRR